MCFKKNTYVKLVCIYVSNSMTYYSKPKQARVCEKFSLSIAIVFFFVCIIIIICMYIHMCRFMFCLFYNSSGYAG